MNLEDLIKSIHWQKMHNPVTRTGCLIGTVKLSAMAQWTDESQSGAQEMAARQIEEKLLRNLYEYQIGEVDRALCEYMIAELWDGPARREASRKLIAAVRRGVPAWAQERLAVEMEPLRDKADRLDRENEVLRKENEKLKTACKRLTEQNHQLTEIVVDNEYQN